MTLAKFEIGIETLARVMICNQGEGMVEIAGRDGGGFAYVEAKDIVSEESIKRTTPVAVWSPAHDNGRPLTAMLLAQIEEGVNNQGGHLYGIKNARDYYLWYVLCRVDKRTADQPDKFEWVTWLANTSTGSAIGGANLYEGHYFQETNFESADHAYAAALDDFNRRL